MKKITLALLVVAIAASAHAQSALNLSWVMHPNLPSKGVIRFYIHNDGNHPVHITGCDASISFDTASGNYWWNRDLMTWDQYVAPWTKENNLDYFGDIRIGNISSRDSLAMERGDAVLKIKISYLDTYQEEKRVMTAIMTLKDHHSPQTLTDKVILREDKKEGN